MNQADTERTNGCGRHTPRFLAAVACLALLCSPWRCQSADSEVEQLEALTREWLALRREIGASASEWRVQSQALEAERRLLARQKDVLTAQIGTRAGETRSSADALTATTRDKAMYEAALLALHPELLRAEAHLRAWPERLPPFLLGPLRAGFIKLPAPDVVADAATVAGRLQVVLGLYSEIEQLHRGLHPGRMILTDPAGREVEAEVLFLGLAAGYALAPDGTTAAVGEPAVAGWTWAWDSSLAPAVRRLLACYRKDTPASFVAVPLAVRSEPEHSDDGKRGPQPE